MKTDTHMIQTFWKVLRAPHGINMAKMPQKSMMVIRITNIHDKMKTPNKLTWKNVFFRCFDAIFGSLYALVSWKKNRYYKIIENLYTYETRILKVIRAPQCIIHGNKDAAKNVGY